MELFGSDATDEVWQMVFNSAANCFGVMQQLDWVCWTSAVVCYEHWLVVM